ncbi:HTTM domain-containing protein [Riemerella columbipharyngis]|uniref:Vitamin K-dependent gamma-carboxylase n=1 Tax=Riemerella columbipharyngis TaxID=1071918 RepID=A0A1G6Y941_9FLAO|nr:HTTM domain-containing protein [Riemerella columbipharyngis]SDD86870.1 Vitamin K-dependent gamma-carboxylase [Riemerella columbipharyngis]
MEIKTLKYQLLKQPISASVLSTYRLFFGVLMLISIGRFFYYDWIYKLYIQPKFFFSYYGFGWIKPLGEYTYGLFALAGLFAFLVMIGKWYRLAIVGFFLTFTYIELMDKTNYLNHYYFISILSFLMIFLPMNASYSLDAEKSVSVRKEFVPAWAVNCIKLLVGIVYLYAGLCKLNSDWLFQAMPLKIWLSSNFYIPVIGPWLDKTATAYIFAWAGALYDISIPFLLWNRKTRVLAFISVVVFHTLTWILFPIGIFPFVMMFGATIYFSEQWHQNFWRKLYKALKLDINKYKNNKTYQISHRCRRVVYPILILFFVIQIFFPWRYLLYPGELFWTEEGFRFSWRVMLMEKGGYAEFRVYNPEKKEYYIIENSDFLTPTQEKQMAFQPDFILQFAQYLKTYFEKEKGMKNVKVFATVYVALNGRKSQLYINPNIDLSNEKESFLHKKWILPFPGSIKGL